MQDENLKLKNTPIPNLLFEYSLPAIIGLIIYGLYNSLDRIFIGNINDIGQLALTGLGVTAPVLLIILSFGNMLAIGGATAISIKQGNGNNEEASHIVVNVLFMTFIIGITLSIIGLTFCDKILLMFGASVESLPYARDYVQIIFLGTTFNLFGTVFNYIIRGDGNPKLSAIIMVSGYGINILLDLLFIFVFSFGIRGASLAMVTAQIIRTFVGFHYYLSGKSNIKIDIKAIKIKWEYMKPVISIGIAPFAMQLATSFAQIVANNMCLLYGGDLAISAMVTINTVVIMFGMPLAGIAAGSQPIVSYNFGAKLYHRAEATLKYSLIAGGIVLVIGWSIVMSFPTAIIKIFSNDAELIALASDGLQKYLSTVPLICITYLGANYIQSTGKALHSFFLSLLHQLLFLAPLFWLLPQFFGLNGVWFALPVADVCSCIITIIVLYFAIKSYHKKDISNDVSYS